MSKIDYYATGRRAAEAGLPAHSSGIPIATVAFRDWKRGYEDWLEENDMTDTVPGSELAQEIATLTAAELGEAGA